MSSILESTSATFSDIRSALSCFMHEGVCDTKIHTALTKMKFPMLQNLISIITNQKFLSKHDEVYSVYKCDVLSQCVEKYTDLTGSTEGLSPMSLQVDDRFLFFNCLSVETLMLLLSENITSSRYVFIQTMFGSEIHNFGHSAFLLFDKLKSNVHFVDPNGRTHFFDTVFSTYNDSKKLSEFDLSINTEHLFELILKKYINDLWREKYGIHLVIA